MIMSSWHHTLPLEKTLLTYNISGTEGQRASLGLCMALEAVPVCTYTSQERQHLTPGSALLRYSPELQQSCSSREQAAASAWTDNVPSPSKQQVGEDQHLHEKKLCQRHEENKELEKGGTRKIGMEQKTVRGGEKQTACSHHEDTGQKLSESKC